MWAQGNQWGNQIPLDAAAYQNMNHELVDWASLAQQWIRMKEVHETVVLNVPEMAQSHFQSNFNLLRSSPAVELQPSDSNVTSGEAPMDVEKEDEITSSVSDWSWQSQSLNQQTHSWPLQHGAFVPRHQFPQVTHPGAANLPIALGPSQTFPSTISPSMNFSPRVPLLPLPPSVRPNSSDEDSLGASSFNSMPTIDASKRKNLPAWIREGLEKMEKEKQKKEEREKFLLERELKRKKELESGGQGDLTVARSRFDDSEEDEDDNADEIKSPLKESTPAVSNAPTLEDIMVRIRRLMTEILLEVTTEEIRSAASEASQRAKVKNRQVQSPLSSKSLTRKLGLDQYGSDSEGDDSDQEAVKAHRAIGFDDATIDSLRGKSYEKQHLVEENRTADRFSQVEKDLNELLKKPSHLVGMEKNKNSGESFSKVLQDGTKVDTDINSKIPHGQSYAETLSSSQKEDSAAKSENISDCKSEISMVRENSSSLKSQNRSNAGSSRSRQRSRTPERRKRSLSRDSSRRSRDYLKSRRRSRSRERKRSNSRRRSHDRRRSISRRRSRSNDRKCSSSKGKERASSKDRRK